MCSVVRSSFSFVVIIVNIIITAAAAAVFVVIVVVTAFVAVIAVAVVAAAAVAVVIFIVTPFSSNNWKQVSIETYLTDSSSRVQQLMALWHDDYLKPPNFVFSLSANSSKLNNFQVIQYLWFSDKR